MNEEQINQAISKACGKDYHKPTEDEIKSGSYYQYEPNYACSLDAMHEAEKVLAVEQWGIYTVELQEILKRSKKAVVAFSLIHATATQRAEAFLRTLNLWGDTK